MAEYLTKSKLFLVIAIVIIAAIGELFFDVFEVAIGQLLQATNPIRPKVGRLWDEEKKELSGDVAMDSLFSQTAEDTLQTLQIFSIADLHSLLLLQNQVQMKRKDFMVFYRLVAPKTAKILLDPLKFLELEKNQDWQSVEFLHNESRISIYFLDGYGQLLYEQYLHINDFDDNSNTLMLSTLDSDPEFHNRTISADLFFQAFLKLPSLYRLQIINDPYKLVNWGDDLIRIGISSRVNMGSVEIAFEVGTGTQTRVYRLGASEIAVGYLIANINKLDESVNISLPKPQEPDNG